MPKEKRIDLEKLVDPETLRQINGRIDYLTVHPEYAESCDPRNPVVEDQEYFHLETPLEIERRSDAYIRRVLASVK